MVHNQSSPLASARAGPSAVVPLGLITLAAIVFLATRLYILFALEPFHTPIRHVYFRYSDRVVDFHLAPYRDFDIEYPPVAWWTMYLPRVLDSRRISDPRDANQVGPVYQTYASRFRGLMFLFELGSFLLLLLIVHRRRPQWVGWAALLYAVSISILGYLLFDHIDTELCFLLLAWAYCWIRSLDESGRSIAWTAASYAMLGLGISLKLIPVIATPFLLLSEWHSPQRRARLATALSALAIAAGLPFVIQYLASGPGVLAMFRYHSERGIEIGSLYSTLMMFVSLFGSPVYISLSHGAYDLSGDLAGGMKALSDVVLFGFLSGMAAWTLWRWSRYRRADAYCAACFVICAAVILAKVLSPQYFLFAIPLAILLAVEILPDGWQHWLLLALLVAVAAMTLWIYPCHFRRWSLEQTGLVPVGDMDPAAMSPLACVMLGLRNLSYLGVVVWLGVMLFRRGAGAATESASVGPTPADLVASVVEMKRGPSQLHAEDQDIPLPVGQLVAAQSTDLNRSNHSISSQAAPGAALRIVLITLAVVVFLATRLYILFALEPFHTPIRNVYFEYAGSVVDFQRVPYQDFEIEYPPIAWWTMYLPRVLDSRRISDPRDAGQVRPVYQTYVDRFRGLMFLFELGSFLLLLLIVHKRRPQWVGWAALLYAVSMGILGYLLYDHIDTELRFLLLAWAYCWIRSLDESGHTIAWTAASYAMLGLGISLKLIPVIATPFLLLSEWHSPQRRARLAAALSALAVAAGLPFVIQYLASGPGVLAMFRYHSERGIEIGSLYSTLMMIGSVTGFPIYASYSHNAHELSGDLAGTMKSLSDVVLLGFLSGMAAWALWRWSRYRRADAYCAACFVICAAIILAKVLSPQFFLFAIPLAILLAVEIFPDGWRHWLLLALLIAVAALTLWVYPCHFLRWSLEQTGLVPVGNMDPAAMSPLACVMLGLRNLSYLGVVVWLGVMLFRRGDSGVGQQIDPQ